MITPEHMAILHARAFGNLGRAWSAQEFSDLLDSNYVFVVGDKKAFALGRVIADEAELLTIATDPDCQRKGLGRKVLEQFEKTALGQRAGWVFLEVAADNLAAHQLYVSVGYSEIARRTGYYKKPCGTRVDALIMEKALG